jgi:peptidoglycan hydrolase CwlO-like protein
LNGSSDDSQEKLEKLQEKMRILKKHMRFTLKDIQEEKIKYNLALRRIYGEGNETRSVERVISLKINKSKHYIGNLGASQVSIM